MLDMKYIRENRELIEDGAKKKRMKCDIERLLTLDEQRRNLMFNVESLRAERNEGSKNIASLSGPEKQNSIERMKVVVNELKAVEPKLKEVEDEYSALLLTVPMPPDINVPVGRDESENVEIRKWGKIPSFGFKAKDHVELSEINDLIDMNRASKISGSRMYFLKNEAALLELGILKMALDLVVSRGFTPIIPPVLVKDASMVGTGYFPIGEEQAYRCERDGLNLVGTAEVPLASYHCDEILPESVLPIKMAGWSPCFRREAGTYGKDTRGIYRIHQFTKVEQVVISESSEEGSRTLHEEILKNSEDLLQMLELPYRVVDVCTGDLGIGQVRKNDIECWMPGRNGYGETHSCSTFYDFQARRLNIRYRRESDGKTVICHTLNNTVIASPRILVPLLEIFQQENGTIIIPDALRPFVGGMKKIGGKQ